MKTVAPKSTIYRYRELWSRIGLSERVIRDRSLPIYTEAETLQLADPSEAGKEFQLVPSAALAWREMRAEAQHEGINIYLLSAYRSLDRQVELIQRKLNNGESLEDVLKVLAPPGCSEHHTGRAVDIGTVDVPALSAAFEATPAFKWLSNNAIRFGFELSFPPGNPFGYLYEPWHWCHSESAAQQSPDGNI